MKPLSILKPALAKIMQKNCLIYLAIILFAYIIGNSLANFLAPAPMPKQFNFSSSSKVNQANGQAPMARQGIEEFKAIEERNLFAVNSHKAPEVATISPETPPAAVETAPSKNVRLVGTIDIDNPTLSRAIIVVDGQQRIIKLNENTAGYTVKSIRRNEVILEANGQELVLEQKLLR